MKVKINNLVELVNALEEHGSLYCTDGTILVFGNQHRGIDIIENGVVRGFDLRTRIREGELETVAPLQDKQPVWCWDNTDNFSRIVRFYDTKNNCTFNRLGERRGFKFDYYEPISINKDGSFPDGFEWMEEAQKNLKD